MKRPVTFVATVTLALSLIGTNFVLLTPTAESVTLPQIPEVKQPLGDTPTIALAPTAPSKLTLSAKTTTTVDLTWADNSSNETSFKIERKTGSGAYTEIGTVGANTLIYKDFGLTAGTTYTYRVRASNIKGNSAYTNELAVTTNNSKLVPGTEPLNPNLKPNLPDLILNTTPSAPSGLNSTDKTASSIGLAWTDTSNNETGFKIECKSDTSAYTEIASVGAGVTNYSVTNLNADTSYTFRVRAYNASGDSAYSNEASVTTESEAPVGTTEIKLYIGSQDYLVNGTTRQMDVAPVVLNGRTLLPARYIAEALGAQVEWIAAENKVVITRGTTTIEMWLNQPIARVNGVEQYIDPNNPEVKPISIPPGRTMTPGRFIAENLGATVGWNEAAQEVTISYTPEAVS